MSEIPSYRFYNYSKAGAHHENLQSKNEDYALAMRRGNYMAAALADGVSTCQYSREGARIAASLMVDLLLQNAEQLFSQQISAKRFAKNLLQEVFSELRKNAESSYRDVEEFSSTLCAVLIDRQTGHIFCMNLGDSLVFVKPQSEDMQIFSPPWEQVAGGVPSTTIPYGASYADIRIESSCMESVVIFSDGGWSSLYHHGKMPKELEEAFQQQDFRAIQQYMDAQEISDDMSMIALVREA